MNKNNYWEKSQEFLHFIEEQISKILDLTNNKIELKANNVNLLNNENNCIESSTAIGFLIEEYISSELERITNHPLSIYKIRKIKQTQNSSYDFYCENENDIFVVNLKVAKKINDAVAAIKQLKTDYKSLVQTKKQVHFLVLKFNYSFEVENNNKFVFLNDLSGFFLEEIDFSKNHLQDKRNWSSTFNYDSGRLMVTKIFLKNNKKEIKDISYKTTLEEILNLNKEK
ncbi:UpaP162 family type II restriction enzyme [Mycoplasma sp. AC157]